MLNRRRNRRRTSERKGWTLPARPWRALGLILGAAAAVVLACVALGHLLDQPIASVRVDGSFQHLSALDVEKAVRANLHGAGLITVDLDRVRRGVSALPWVDVATVQRSWPRGLTVHVAEQVAVARWNANRKLGQAVALEAMDEAMRLADEFGAGTVAVDNAFHYLWGGGYVMGAAKRGYIAYTNCTASIAAVVPFGGKYPTTVIPSTLVLDRQHRVAAVFLRELLAADLQPVVQRLAQEPK